MEVMPSNNKISLEGETVSELIFSHEVLGEKFYSFHMDVRRLSEIKDRLSVTVSEKVIKDLEYKPSKFVTVSGQLRTYNKIISGSKKLILTVFVKDIKDCTEKADNPNQVYLNGFLCKQPVYRMTPLGREISDMIIAVNRSYGKSDYIPVIAWGGNSRFCKEFIAGDNIKIWGRLQSREYSKKISEDEIKLNTAYEVSVSKVERNGI
ncbi:MAG: single-stranded DNA-binding protein [Clostridiaceae bacterium]